eukprot:SAG11_NODE_2472_length_3319_cov_2.525155_1_plen_113_part_10
MNVNFLAQAKAAAAGLRLKAFVELGAGLPQATFTVDEGEDVEDAVLAFCLEHSGVGREALLAAAVAHLEGEQRCAHDLLGGGGGGGGMRGGFNAAPPRGGDETHRPPGTAVLL